MTVTHAAWVPDDEPQRDWAVAADLAVRWVEARCREEQASGVLVTNTLDHLGIPDLQAFAARHAHTTRRSDRDRVGAGVGPVLAYLPGIEELEFAMGLARRSSLAVVESVEFPLRGWAALLAAENLLTGEATPPLPDKVNDAVERLKFYGNNGFGDPFGKKQARSVLNDLRDAGELDPGVLLGAILAAGVPARGVKNLDSLIAGHR